MGGVISRKKSAPPPPPPAPPKPVSVTAKGKGQAEDTDVQITSEGDAGMLKRRRRGKRALVKQPAAANVGGEGTSGLNIPKG